MADTIVIYYFNTLNASDCLFWRVWTLITTCTHRSVHSRGLLPQYAVAAALNWIDARAMRELLYVIVCFGLKSALHILRYRFMRRYIFSFGLAPACPAHAVCRFIRFSLSFYRYPVSCLPVNGIVIWKWEFYNRPVPWPETTKCDNNDALIHNVMLPFDGDDGRWWRFWISFGTSYFRFWTR